MRTVLIGTLWLLLHSAAMAQTIYKTVDENGNVSYSDRPPNGARSEDATELPPVNALPEQGSSNPYPSRREAEPEETEPVDYTVSLASPAHESHVNPGQRDLPIVVNLSPALAPSHRIAFYMNGELLAEGRSNQYVVEEIFRGEHQIRAVIVDDNGNTLRETETVTIYVHRPSKLN